MTTAKSSNRREKRKCSYPLNTHSAKNWANLRETASEPGATQLLRRKRLTLQEAWANVMKPWAFAAEAAL
jgi:hypothetical protein